MKKYYIKNHEGEYLESFLLRSPLCKHCGTGDTLSTFTQIRGDAIGFMSVRDALRILYWLPATYKIVSVKNEQ